MHDNGFEQPWCDLRALDDRGHELDDATVFMLPGTYVHYYAPGELDPIEIDADDFSLRTATGLSDVVIRVGSVDPGPFIRLRGDRITIEGLEIVGNLTFSDSAPAAGQYMSTIFEVFGSSGIGNPVADDITFRGVTIRDFIPADPAMDVSVLDPTEPVRGNAINTWKTSGLLIEDSSFTCTLIDPTGCTVGENNCATPTDLVKGDAIKFRYGDAYGTYDDATVRNNVFGDCGHYALMGGTLIENNVFHNRLHACASPGPDGTVMRNNVCYEFDMYPSEHLITGAKGAGFQLFDAQNTQVYNNVIYDGYGYSIGIIITGSAGSYIWGNEVFNNLVYNVGGHGIALYSPMEEHLGLRRVLDTQIRNNLVFGVSQTTRRANHEKLPNPLLLRGKSPGSWAAFAADTEGNNLVQNNLLLDSDQDPAEPWSVTLATFADGSNGEVIMVPDAFDLAVVTADGNITFGAPLTAADLFEWTDEPDGTKSFRLLPTIDAYGGIPNPALDAGYCDALAAPGGTLMDADGRPRDWDCDIGPFECGDHDGDGDCDAQPCVTDTDGDGICDEVDNCTLVANPAQLDVDEDGFGNSCDADFGGQPCIVDIDDLSDVNTAFGTMGPSIYDVFDEDGVVGASDLGAAFTAFGQAPGPSGRVPSGCTP